MLKKLSFLLSAAASLLSPVHGQQLDNPVTIPVQLYGSAIVANSGTQSYFSFGTGQGLNVEQTSNQAGGTEFYSSVQTHYLIPGKSYDVTVTSTNCAVVFARFQSSNGAEIYLRGYKGNTISMGSNYTFSLRVELINDITHGLTGKRGGEVSAFAEDKPIWYVGLGTMRDGRFAGAVGFRAPAITSDLFNSSSLIYDTVNADEVEVVRDSNGYITEVTSREVVLKVDPYQAGGTSYSIEAYSASDLVNPFAVYTISQLTVSGGVGIRVDREEDGVNWSTALQKVGSVWTRYDWQRLAPSSTAFSAANAVTTTVNGSTSTVSHGSGAGATVKQKTYTSGELSSVTWGPSLADPQTSTYAYYSTSSGTGWTSALQSVVRPTGSWIKYDYYNATSQDGAPGTIHRIHRPWKDSPSAPGLAAPSSGHVTTYKYALNYDGSKTAVSERSTAIDNIVVGKSTWEYAFSHASVNAQTVARTIRKDFASTGPTDYLVTTTLSYRPDNSVTHLRGRAHAVTYPDGRKDAFAYFTGTWDSSTQTFTENSTGDDRLTLVFHGQTEGGTSLSSWTVGQATWVLDPLHMVSGKSTVSTSVVDTTGRTMFIAEDVYNSGVLERISGTSFSYDGHNRLAEQQDVTRDALTTTYTYEALSSGTHSFIQTVTAPDGVVNQYKYDEFLRLATTVAGFAGPTSHPARIEDTVYNVANLPAKTYSCLCATSPVTYKYDAAGRVTHKYEKAPDDPDTDSAGSLVTQYEYPTATSRRMTWPSGATQIEDFHLDGRAKSLSGTAQPEVRWEYEPNATGVKVTRKNGTSLANGWEELQQDYLGRVIKRSVPTYGYNATNSTFIIDQTWTYDTDSDGAEADTATGLLVKRATTYRADGSKQLPDQLYVYDGAGRVTSQGWDVNGNGNLAAGSNDRITTIDRYLESVSGSWYGVVETKLYATLDSSSLTPVAETRTRLTGFDSGVVSEITTIDAAGRTTTRTESVAPGQKRREVQTAMTGVSNVVSQTFTNGYDHESTTPAGDRVEKIYDSRGRISEVRSRWDAVASVYGATDTYEYYNATSYVESYTVAGVPTTFAYEWSGGKRTVTTTDVFGNVSYTRYNEMSQPDRIGGAGASATAFGYDAFGRRTSMTTWRTGPYDESNWPANGGDTTTWTPDPATGLVTKKTYADSNDVEYTYTPLGQVKTRTWARGVTTTYDYYDGSLTSATEVSHGTQELAAISYSDSTPELVFTYRRSGLPAGVSDATGSRTFDYASANPLLLEKETLGSFYNNGTSARLLRPQYDTLVRATGFKLGTSSNDDLDLSQTGDYLSDTGLYHHRYTARNEGAQGTYTYTYKPSESLVAGYTTGNFAASYDYDESSAARRSKVEGTWSGSSRTRFDFSYDDRGQLQYAKQGGSAFTDYYSGTAYSSMYNLYVYDERGQLETAITYRGTPPSSGVPASADELPGRRFEYRYDGAGNRVTVGAEGGADEGEEPYDGGDDQYGVNSVNQYTTKEYNSVRVLGTAVAAATVTVGSTGTINPTSSVVRRDRSFAANLDPDNVLTPAAGTVTITSTLPGTGGNPTLVRTASRDWQIPGQVQSFSYDADGNLENDGIWEYDYDAENRLIRMETTSGAVSAGLPNRVLEFKYDFMGRRVQKRSQNISASTDGYTRYLYDNWNLVAEFNAPGGTSCGSLVRSYTWGLDVVGSLGASGGVGALLQIADHATSKTYLPTYDGNGNVSSLVDAANGSLAAVYEYSPFGELLRAEGSYAANNPFRFSTKFTDHESGLVYYGYRYYSPSLGRFINRDPIGEQGGRNLYAFAGNNPINGWDVLGLSAFDGEGDEHLAHHDENGCEVYGYYSEVWDANDGNPRYTVTFNITRVVCPSEIPGIPGRPGGPGGPGDSPSEDSPPAGPAPGGDGGPPASPNPVAPNNTDLSKLPGCSELRKAIEAGKSPAVTAQSFIESPTAKVPYAPLYFRGDGRGFVGSPADGVSPGQTFRTTASVAWQTPATGQAGITRGLGVLSFYSGQARPDVRGNVEIERYRSGPGSTQYNPNIQYVELSASGSDPAFNVLGYDFAPPAAHSVSATINFETGFVGGSVTHTNFPGLQVFVGNQPVYNYSAEANGKGTLDIYDKTTNTFSKVICDPSR